MNTARTAQRVGIATTGRADYSCLLPLIQAVAADDDFNLVLYATGTHYSDAHGRTVDEILEAGFGDVLVPVPCEIAGDDAKSLAATSGAIFQAFAEKFDEQTPDILLVLGDRYDLLPIVAAAVPFGIPVGHLSGGEETEGVIDNVVRHAVSKLAHIHFPTLDAYRDQLIRMGEEAWRITVTGEPSLDILRDFAFAERSEVFAAMELAPGRPVTVFTYHPETSSNAGDLPDLDNILRAADDVDCQIVFTLPGADLGAGAVRDKIEAYAAERDDCSVYAHLGRTRYFNLLRHAQCMVGNSSSGIVEASSFELPVVDIGNRQQGRIAPRNVLRVPAETSAIVEAWRRALTSSFRGELKDMSNPYGDGGASERVLERLRSLQIDDALTTKSYGHLFAQAAA